MKNGKAALFKQLETALLHARTYDAYSVEGRRKIKALKMQIKQLTA